MKLIILDRDGVINQDSDNYIKSVDEFIPLPGSLSAITRLNQAGYQVYIATNQSGIARGYYDAQTLQAMHDKLARLLAIEGGHVDGIFVCPHGPQDGCDCRKPKPGLLLQIRQHTGVELHAVPVIGDSLRDLQAAEAVGARPILVRTGKGQHTLDKGIDSARYEVFGDLAAAVDFLLNEDKT